MSGRTIRWRRLCLRLGLITLVTTVIVWLVAWLVAVPVMEHQFGKGIAAAGIALSPEPIIRIHPLRGQIRLETGGWVMAQQGLSGHLETIDLRLARLATLRGPDIVVDALRITGLSIHGWAGDDLLPIVLPLPEMPELPDDLADDAILDALRIMPPPTTGMALWDGLPNVLLRLSGLLRPPSSDQRGLRIHQLAIDASAATPIMDGDPLALISIAGRGHLRQNHDDGDHSRFVGRLGTAGIGHLIIDDCTIGPAGGTLSLDWQELPVDMCVLSDPQRGRLRLGGQARLRLDIDWNQTEVTGTITLHIKDLSIVGPEHHALVRSLSLLEQRQPDGLDLDWSMTITGSPEQPVVLGADAAGLAHALGQVVRRL